MAIAQNPYSDNLAIRRLYAQRLRVGERLRRKRQKKKEEIRNIKMQVVTRDFMLVFAGIIAIFKDLLDLALITSMPLVGTVLTLCISSVIIMIIMIHVSAEKYHKMRKMINRGGLVITASIIEGFAFGLNFLPIETIAVIATYFMIMKDRRRDIKALSGDIVKIKKGSYLRA